jgi:hypothetical protein
LLENQKYTKLLIEKINPKAKIITDTIRIRPEKSEVFRLFGSNEKLKLYIETLKNIHNITTLF